MIVDANAFLGDWAFRSVDGSPEGLIDLMDEKGLDRALVSAFEGATYRNTQAANRELADAVEGYRDRLHPVATIDPTYATPEQDLEEGVDDLGMRAVKLLPTYHYYDLDDPAVVDVVERATDLGVPVIIAFALEDQRQRHPAVRLHGFEGNHRDQMTEAQAGQLIDLLKAVPESDVIVADAWTHAFRIRQAVSHHRDGLHLANAPHTGALQFVLGDLFMYYTSQGERIADELGAEHLCVGPMLPLKIFESYYGYLEHLPVEETAKERIRGENVLNLL
ncbi:MAG: amidohydrolase family protein [Halobacteriales archaeon]